MDAALRQTMVGKYSILASLGRGGMANVYLALMSGPSGFNKLLVLKILRDDLETSHEDLAAMFLNEARLAARLHHPCIVQTYEFGDLEGRPFIAMEYLEGQPLRAVQRKFAPSGLPLAEEIRVLAETARALHYAHGIAGFDGEQLSVVHRDVSPQNVFLTYEGQVKLLDFGIAKTDAAEHMTKVGSIKGKIDYMAPEQVRGDKVDRRADVFALGAMLWEAITGERFGGGPKLAEVTKIHRRLTAAEPSVRELRPDVPEVLASLVEESLAMNPADRVATAAQFADRLEVYLSRLPTRPTDRTLAELLVGRYQEDLAQRRKLIDRQVKIIQEKGKMLESLRSDVRPLDFGLTSTGVFEGSAPSRSAASFTPSRRQPSSLSRSLPQVQPSSRKAALLAGTALVLAGALAMTFVLRGGRDPAGAAAPVSQGVAAPAQVEVSAAPSTPGVARTVKVGIAVSPQTASATLDGAPLSKLPFTGTFQASEAIHHLQVSADGYQTERQLVTFDEDRTIMVELSLLGAPPRARPARPGSHVSRPAEPAATNPAKAPAIVEEPAAREEERAPDLVDFKAPAKSRRFDRTDPYAN